MVATHFSAEQLRMAKEVFRKFLLMGIKGKGSFKIKKRDAANRYLV